MSSPAPLTALLTLGASADRLGAILTEAGRPPTLGTLDGAALARVVAEVAALLVPEGGLLIPGDDGDAVAAERRAGLLLAGLLSGPGMAPIHSRLGQLAGRSEATGAPLALLIDARDTALRQLPWELLEGVPPGDFGAAGIHVGRVSAGRGAEGNGGASRLEVLLWRPDPADPVCAHVARCLVSELGELRRVTLRELTAPLEEPPAPGVFRVVHVICHGQAQLDRVMMKTGAEKTLASESVARWWGPTLSAAGLVILDVCGAAAGEVDPLDAPAWRLVSAGVPACVAPRSPFDAEASITHAAALYGALANGAGLLTALAQGRRALTALGLAHPSFRWWNPLLVVGDGSAVATAPLAGRRALDAWPRGTAEAEAALTHAEGLGRVQGFLGVEHLAQILSRWEPASPRLRLFQPALGEVGRDLVSFGLDARESPSVTPRILALSECLEQGYDLDALLTVILDVPWVHAQLSPQLLAHAAEPRPGVSKTTLRIDSGEITRRLAQEGVEGIGLEVWGGPEDGRRVELVHPGQLVGRWDPDGGPGAETGLYRDGIGVDRTVSRRHLRYDGDTTVSVLAPTRLKRRRAEAPIGGPVALERDDLLVLGLATRLRVLWVPGAR